jgi:hypothetical protein
MQSAASVNMGSDLPFAAFAHKISVEAGSDRRQCGQSANSLRLRQCPLRKVSPGLTKLK